MTLLQIIDAIGSFSYANPGLIICILLSLVEVSGIKINPWSWLLQKICGISGFLKKIDAMEAKISNIEIEQARMRGEAREAEAKAARARILRFGDEVYNGTHHSKEYFDHILADISHYKKYCEEHPEFQNEITVITVQHIEQIYGECLKNHSFL